MTKATRPTASASALDFPRPLASVDIVAFAAREERLWVLLVRRGRSPGEPFPGRWALPGGFVDVVRDADLEACARRKLQEKTGVTGAYLEPLGSWGSARRDPRGWSATHVYFALLSPPIPGIAEGGNAEEVAWQAVEGAAVRTHLAFDHDEIVTAALQRLRGKTEYTSLPAHLLPSEFTLSELQHVYEIVLARPLEKSAFRTRVLAAKLVVPLAKYREAANRPAQLYRLRERGVVYFPRTFQLPR